MEHEFKAVRGLRREDLGGAVSNKVSAEAAESPVLEAITRERLIRHSRLKRLTVWCSDL
jgi:hypothetical protein